MALADLRASHKWLNFTDRCEYPDLIAWAPILGSQAPDAHWMFPDPQYVLSLQPYLPGLAVSHDVTPPSWNGVKDLVQYRQDSGDRILKFRRDHSNYLASYRALARRLEADDVAYPGVPPLHFQARATLGSAYELSPGQPVYSPDMPGEVVVRSVLGRDLFYTPYVMESTLLSSWALDKMAQEFLTPVYAMRSFRPDTKFAKAWRKGDEAAHPYAQCIPSGKTSRERGAYARRAARAYHNAYLKAYHAK